MAVNWKVRFKNKVFLTTLASLVVGCVFNILKVFNIVPTITENEILEIIAQILTILGVIGIIVDPTTAGLGDSQRAMGYEEPWQDPKPPAEEKTKE